MTIFVRHLIKPGQEQKGNNFLGVTSETDGTTEYGGRNSASRFMGEGALVPIFEILGEGKMIERCVDSDWYLSFLVWMPTLGFLGFLIFTLWTGKLYVRGPVFTRNERPSGYWFGVGVIAVFLAISIYFIAADIRCVGWPHL
jgi:hypothetical protein